MATYEEIGEYLNNPITSKLVDDIKKIICNNCIGDCGCKDIFCSTCNRDFAIANVLIENEKNNSKIKTENIRENEDNYNDEIPRVVDFHDVPRGYTGDFILETKNGQEGWIMCDNGKAYKDRG